MWCGEKRIVCERKKEKRKKEKGKEEKNNNIKENKRNIKKKSLCSCCFISNLFPPFFLYLTFFRYYDFLI